MSENEYPSIQDTVLGKTYEVTGIFFVKPDIGVHPLVPKTLRELQNYLAFLHSIQSENQGSEVDASPAEKRRIRLRKVDRFKEYFTRVWINNNLKDQFKRFLNEFLDRDLSERNRFLVLRYFNEIDFKGYEHEIPDDWVYRLNYLLDRQNKAQNISIGDVLALLDIAEEFSLNDAIDLQNFAIKTLYTIELQIGLLKSNGEDCEKIIAGRIYLPWKHQIFPRRELTSHKRPIERNWFKILQYHEISFPDDGKSEWKTLTAYGKQIANGAANTQNAASYFDAFVFAHSFIYFQDVGLEFEAMDNPSRARDYRKDDRTYYDQSSRFNEKVGREISICHFDMLAWVNFWADPMKNLKRIFGKVDPSMVRNSVFNTSVENGKLICPFPEFYNLEVFSVIISRAKKRLELIRKDGRQLNSTSEEIRRLFEVIDAEINEMHQNNSYLISSQGHKPNSHPISFKEVNPLNHLSKLVIRDGASIRLNSAVKDFLDRFDRNRANPFEGNWKQLLSNGQTETSAKDDNLPSNSSSNEDRKMTTRQKLAYELNSFFSHIEGQESIIDRMKPILVDFRKLSNDERTIKGKYADIESRIIKSVLEYAKNQSLEMPNSEKILQTNLEDVNRAKVKSNGRLRKTTVANRQLLIHGILKESEKFEYLK